MESGHKDVSFEALQINKANKLILCRVEGGALLHYTVCLIGEVGKAYWNVFFGASCKHLMWSTETLLRDKQTHKYSPYHSGNTKAQNTMVPRAYEVQDFFVP